MLLFNHTAIYAFCHTFTTSKQEQILKCSCITCMSQGLQLHLLRSLLLPRTFIRPNWFPARTQHTPPATNQRRKGLTMPWQWSDDLLFFLVRQPAVWKDPVKTCSPPLKLWYCANPHPEAFHRAAAESTQPCLSPEAGSKFRFWLFPLPQL